MALDHDLFSFHDYFLNTWPLILITNPKNARYYSNKEPLDLIAQFGDLLFHNFLPQEISPLYYFLFPQVHPRPRSGFLSQRAFVCYHGN